MFIRVAQCRGEGKYPSRVTKEARLWFRGGPRAHSRLPSQAQDDHDVLFCDGNCYRGSAVGFDAVITVWEKIWDSTEAKMPDGSPVAGGISGFDIKLHDGEIWMTNQDLGYGAYGFPNGIVRLTDVDGDGKYNSVGETHIWTDEFVDKARAIDFYGSD